MISKIADARDGSTFAIVSPGNEPRSAIVRLAAADGAVVTAAQTPKWTRLDLLIPLSDGGVFTIFGEGGTKARTSALFLDRNLNVRSQTILDMSNAEGVISGSSTPDGGVILAMRSGDRSEAMKLSAQGNVEWRKTYDTSGSDYMAGIVAAREGYVAWGRTECGVCPYLMRLRPDGTILWSRVFKRGGVITRAFELPNGDIVSTGITNLDDESALWIQKLDSDGKEVFELASADCPATRAESCVLSDRILVIATVRDQAFLVALSTDGAILGQSAMRFSNEPLPTGGAHRVYLRTGDALIAFDSADAVPACAAPSATRIRFTPVQLVGNKLDFDVSADTREAPAGSALPKLEPAKITAAACAKASAAAVAEAASEDAVSRRMREIAGEFRAFRARVTDMLLRKDFDGLDALAIGLRQVDQEAQPGSGTLFGTIANPGLKGTINPAEHLALLNEWAKAMPKSTAARLAIAEYHYQRGWQLRSGETSDKVTESGAEGYRTELDAFRDALKDAEGATADPEYHLLAIRLAGETGGNVQAAAMQSLKAGIHAEPFETAANYLLPNWGGSPETYAAFAAQATDATRSVYGDSLYATLAYWAIVANHSAQLNPDLAFKIPTGKATLLNDLKFSWPRTKRGFQDFLSRYPWELTYFHRFAKAAAIAGDRATTLELFKKPELAWSDSAERVWEKRDYEDTKKWVFEPTVEETVNSLGLSRIALRSSIKTSLNEYRFVNSFLVETQEGLAVMSAILGDPPVAMGEPMDSHGVTKEWLVSAAGRNEAPITVKPKSHVGYSYKRVRSKPILALIAGPRPPFEAAVLKPGYKKDGQAMIVGCSNGAAQCVPKPFLGRLVIGQMGTSDSPAQVEGEVGFQNNLFFFDPEDTIDVASLTGAPVIQSGSQGGVVGIVIGALNGRAVCQSIQDAGMEAGLNGYLTTAAPASRPPSRGTTGGN